jgi:hypothetical protein
MRKESNRKSETLVKRIVKQPTKKQMQEVPQALRTAMREFIDRGRVSVTCAFDAGKIEVYYHRFNNGYDAAMWAWCRECGCNLHSSQSVPPTMKKPKIEWKNDPLTHFSDDDFERLEVSGVFFKVLSVLLDKEHTSA